MTKHKPGLYDAQTVSKKELMEIIYKRNLDISKKVNNNNDEVVKVPKDKVIKTLKILEGLKRMLLETIK